MKIIYPAIKNMCMGHIFLTDSLSETEDSRLLPFCSPLVSEDWLVTVARLEEGQLLKDRESLGETLSRDPRQGTYVAMAALMDERQTQSDIFCQHKKSVINNAFIQRDGLMLHGLENYQAQ